MFRTFNMGVGMTLVIPPADVDAVTDLLLEHRHPATQIGEIIPGTGTVQL